MRACFVFRPTMRQVYCLCRASNKHGVCALAPTPALLRSAHTQRCVTSPAAAHTSLGRDNRLPAVSGCAPPPRCCKAADEATAGGAALAALGLPCVRRCSHQRYEAVRAFCPSVSLRLRVDHRVRSMAPSVKYTCSNLLPADQTLLVHGPLTSPSQVSAAARPIVAQIDVGHTWGAASSKRQPVGWDPRIEKQGAHGTRQRRVPQSRSSGRAPCDHAPYLGARPTL